MSDQELEAQDIAMSADRQADESRVKHKPDLTLIQAMSMSVVAILAVAVGTVYGTVLF